MRNEIFSKESSKRELGVACFYVRGEAVPNSLLVALGGKRFLGNNRGRWLGAHKIVLNKVSEPLPNQDGSSVCSFFVTRSRQPPLHSTRLFSYKSLSKGFSVEIESCIHFFQKSFHLSNVPTISE